MRPATNILKSIGVWRDPGLGLACFSSPAFSLALRLPATPAPLVAVGGRFRVMPLLGMVGRCARFHLLAFSSNGARLLRCESGRARQIDMRDEIMPEADLLMEVVKVDHPEVHLKFAVALFGEPVRALQLVWTDDDRCWPWDRGWNNGRRRQPVFGVRSSWPPPNAGSTRRHRKRI